MQNRINKINEYFLGFEIASEIVYIKAKFPTNWQMPSNEILNENFNVSVTPFNANDGYYFFSNINNGVFSVFDAIDFTIEFNINLKEKTELLKIKLDELKNIFAENPIESLRTLEFKITKTPNKKKKREIKKIKEKKCTNKEEPIEQNVNIVSEIKDECDYANMDVSNITPNNLVEFSQKIIEK